MNKEIVISINLFLAKQFLHVYENNKEIET